VTNVENPVITADQAKKITGGREPLLPAEFEKACRDLASCRTFDEAKYWSDKASALAAWAKIYHSTRIAREARLLKLHAYRRMAELAKDIKKAKGTAPAKVLAAQGFEKWEADEVMAVGRAPQEVYERALAKEVPPSPAHFRHLRATPDVNVLQQFYRFCLRTDARDFAAAVPDKERAHLKRVITRIAEWADEFEQHLKE
jgi:hypothetical protein